MASPSMTRGRVAGCWAVVQRLRSRALLGLPAAPRSGRLCLRDSMMPFPLAAVAVSSRPIVLGWLGFTAGGIAAAITSSMKSRAAIANGGRVAVNSLVSKLQSTGECPGRHHPQHSGYCCLFLCPPGVHPLSLLQVLKDPTHQPMSFWV